MNNREARQAIETVLRIEDLHLGSIRSLRRVQDYLREVEREGKGRSKARNVHATCKIQARERWIQYE